jgi:hypothetical protein
MRFVLVSFAFLGLAFYELSGGADFEPRGVRPPAPEPRTAMARVATVQPVAATALVTRPAIAPRRTTTETTATDTTQSRSDLIRALAVLPADDTGTDGGFVTDDGRVASLGEIATRVRVTAPPAIAPAKAAPTTDLRAVSGTRVNMRDGPGTIYPVIARLQLGQEVQVLDDSGTGWLRLRTTDDQIIGWASKSLIGDPG